MTRFTACFTIDRLIMPVHLGVPDRERAGPQPVALSLRFYFPELPECAHDDHADFIDYDALSVMLSKHMKEGKYRLIEYLAHKLFTEARAYLDQRGGKKLVLWLKVTKLSPPVPHLEGGVSFVVSDLPAGASLPPVE